MDKFKKINIQTLKKILQVKGYKVSKKHQSLVNIYYTVGASIFLILIFYSIPFINNFSSKKGHKNKPSNKLSPRITQQKRKDFSFL